MEKFDGDDYVDVEIRRDNLAGAPREALYLCMRKSGKPAGGTRSP